MSLEQGCDGAATVAATDGRGAKNGFEKEVVRGAPEGALGRRADGERVLASTVGNWMGGPNQKAVEWLHGELGSGKAYVVGGTGVPDVGSRNRVLAVEMF